MTALAERLQESVRARSAGVGVIGLGYAGLPLAVAFAEAGFQVLGFDTDPSKVDKLERGESYLGSISSSRLAALREQGVLRATGDLGRLGEPDVLLICVPTPLGDDRQPDLRFVLETGRAIAGSLTAGKMVILESTTFPGTTEEHLAPLLEESGLRAGRDFLLAYSPEREDPGNPRLGLDSTPKVVGGTDDFSTSIAADLYRSIAPEVVLVSSAAVAEACKLTENVFRAVNIALVNELKMIFDHLDIDVWEVLDAAATKPFGFMRFDPGPGWGGHCIPIDPFYLAWRAQQAGADARFVQLAGEINTLMPRWVVQKLETALAQRGKELAGSRILLLGLAYKKDVDDPRESPAFEVLSILRQREAEVSYHDPHIPETPPMRSWGHLPTLRSLPLEQETLAAQDAVVIVTDHADVDYRMVLEHSQLVVDTRGIYRQPSDRIVRA